MTESAERKTSVAILSVLSNSGLVVLKIVVGLLIGSVSIMSEAIHSGIDLLAAAITFLAVRTSGKEADEQHPYGHGKFENVSGTVEAVLIFVAAVWIIYEAVHRFLKPGAVEMPVWGVAVMFVSAAVNIVVSRRLFKVGKETDSVALQADAWHLRTDVYTSAGVMVGMAAILIGRSVSPGTNLNWIDPTVAILVALMIMRAAYNLTRESARDLLDVSIPAGDIQWINDYIAGMSPPVRSVHKMRTRKAGSHQFIDFHLTVDETMSVAESHALGDEICIAIKKHLPNANVQIHIEPCALECTESCVAGCRVDKSERTAVLRASPQVPGETGAKEEQDETNTIAASSEPD